MNLTKSFAFQVTAQRTSTTKTAPNGGRFEATQDLRGLLTELSNHSDLINSTSIHFIPDGADTSAAESIVRNLILAISFSEDEADGAALQIATRLADSTDGRSWPTCLLVIAVFSDNESRKVVMWSFPREDVFRLSKNRNKPSVELLTDVFSKSSRARKAALFEGLEGEDEFWSGRILDDESGSEDRKAADYWMKLFLNARFEVDSTFGTSQVVGLIKKAMKTADPQMREELFAMSIAVPRAPKQTWTPAKMATRFLSPQNRDRFLQSVPEAIKQSSFEIDKNQFQAQFSYRVFETEENVWISAPVEELDKSVKYHKDTGEISFQGRAIAMQPKARHVT